MILKHGTAQARFRGCAPVLNAGRAGSCRTARSLHSWLAFSSSDDNNTATLEFQRRMWHTMEILLTSVADNRNPDQILLKNVAYDGHPIDKYGVQGKPAAGRENPYPKSPTRTGRTPPAGKIHIPNRPPGPADRRLSKKKDDFSHFLTL